MQKYRATNYGNIPAIETVEVVRETEKCVWVDWAGYGEGSRRAKTDRAFEAYFDTFQEAKDWLVTIIECRLKEVEAQEKNLPLEFDYLKAEIAEKINRARKQLGDVLNIPKHGK